MKQLSEEKDMWQKCNEMANQFLTHRQVGECEAFYKLFANMHMTYSSVATIFVPTDPKGHRRQFLQRQDPESGQGFQIEGREGHFLEKPDLISKYERRKLLPRKGEEEEDEEMLEQSEAAKGLEELTFCQFIKMFEGKGWQQRTNEEGEVEQSDDEEDRPEEGQLDIEDEFNYVITGFEQEDVSAFNAREPSTFDAREHSTFDARQHSKKVAPRRKLPQLLTLRDPVPGEPKILHKRTFPRALRFFKRKHESNPHFFYFSQLILYHPFRDENQLFPEDPQKCEELFYKNQQKIKSVKAQLMPFLESVEDAQIVYEQMKANDDQDIEDKMGADLDPEMEQEIADGDDLDDEEHPDYYHIDPDQLETNPDRPDDIIRVFKSIVLPSKDLQVIMIYSYYRPTPFELKYTPKFSTICLAQVEQARKLDRRQKEVLGLALNYARKVVTHPIFSKKQYLPRPTPPLVIVHGGAGSGKSFLISSIYAMMTDALQKAGDDPDCPYVLLTSFTGAASANINGQTLHSTFSFKFGATFLSMPEKQKAEKRVLFQNLRCLIIDEISMVSADMLYNVDLRLREITGRLDTVFGGISVFLFGDLYQLQPTKARFVFDEPTNKEHALSYRLRNLWKLFTVVNLEENHRQGEDKVYADLLNRVRTAEHTEEDIATLQTRVCARDDPNLDSNALHIYGTNAKVNARNEAKLNEIDGKLYIIKAKNSSRTVTTFSTNKAGCIMNTPFMAVLKVKVGCEVVMVHNVDTLDGLTNGCRGVLVDVEKKGEAISRLVVKLHNPQHGRLARQKNPCKKFPQATYINAIHWTYLLGGATAMVYQFPLKGASALSSHKIQVSTLHGVFVTFLKFYPLSPL